MFVLIDALYQGEIYKDHTDSPALAKRLGLEVVSTEVIMAEEITEETAQMTAEQTQALGGLGIRKAG